MNLQNVFLVSLTIVLLLLAWALFPKQLIAELGGLFHQRRKSMPPIKAVIQSRSSKTKRLLQYKNKLGETFQPGDKVKLNRKSAFIVKDPTPATFLGEPIKSSTIASLFPDVDGLVLLENKLGGFWTWSVDDLRKSRR